MPLEPALFLGLLLFGAWAGIDGTSVGQFMVSRPVVAATVAGWIAGDPAAGALVGLLLEALFLTVLPVGAARYPEVGPAAVCAGAAVALHGQVPGALVSAVAFALSWAWLSGLSVRLLRQLNIRLVSRAGRLGGGTVGVTGRHLSAIAADTIRAALLTLAGLFVAIVVVGWTTEIWALDPAASRVVLWSLAAASIAASIRLFGERRLTLFLVGALGGLLLLVLL